jgi:immunity protein 53 of polymorphic toxin system
MTTIAELAAWFQQQCNGEWEHTYGLTIQSTDNPGWWVTIDLRGTPLEHTVFEPVLRGDFASGNPQPPWLHCRVKDAVFHAACDADHLDEILGIFLAWTRTA